MSGPTGARIPGSSRIPGPPRIPGEGYVGDRGVHHARSDASGRPCIGVLALQGDVLEHLRLLDGAGADAVPVRRPADLVGIDGIVIPGGESTTIGKLLDRFELLEPLREGLGRGLPALGTCAGAIVLGRDTMLADGRPTDQQLLGVLDVTTRRNAFGRQVASFEGPVHIDALGGGADHGLDDPMHGVFIRAPWFERVGPDVTVLGTVETPLGARVVVVQQGSVLACAFHPELSGDDRLHRRLVDLVRSRTPDVSQGHQHKGHS